MARLTDRDMAMAMEGPVPSWPARPESSCEFRLKGPREWAPKEPRVFRVKGKSAVNSVAAPLGIETSIVSGAAGPLIFYTWPGALRVTGIWCGVLSGLDVDLAGLRWSILLEDQEQLFTDGFRAQTAPALPMGGTDHRFFPLDRRVQGGDVWQLQGFNDGAATVAPRLYVMVRSDRRGEIL
jgi:hypothetical protein